MNFINKLSLQNKYILTTLSYGITRKVIRLHSATIYEYDYDKKCTLQHPVLICDKMLIASLGAISAIYLWPIYMFKDLRSIEISLKNDNYYKEENKRHIINYLID